VKSAVLILAGGKSLRLGRQKAGVLLGGETLLGRAIRLTRPLGEVWVVGDGRPLPLPPGIRMAADLFPGKGPLGGVYTGLLLSPSPYALAVACDMPFVNSQLLGSFLTLAPGYDAVVPRVGELLEPLHAVYSRRCLPVMNDLLRQGKLSLLEVFPRVKVRYVEGMEMGDSLPFFNINTPQDLEKAQTWLRET
jgi:molybdopterin-guanine dinucleotide biosynthesis protein A